METYGNYEALDKEFVFRVGKVVCIHKECTKSYTINIKKSSIIRSCDNCRSIHENKKVTKRLNNMAKVQDVLNIMAMPRITMEQVKVLQRFTHHYNYKNANKVRLMERVKNYASYA